MTDTPETDGEWNRLACQDHSEFERNLADFARKLERERDEIRAQLREEQQLHVQTLNERDDARDQLRKAQVENDHNWRAMELYEAERELSEKQAATP